MRQRFVPPSYQHDFRKKLQRLDQGDMFVQDYYAELQKGMIHAGVHEETKDKICHFYGGLQTNIHDIVDYKEYNTVNRLFQLAMLAEKEFQGQQPTRLKSSFMPHHTSIGRTCDIKCHRCHGVGHFQRDCPSKKSYIATDDRGYVSASDVEDDFVLQTNNAGDLDDDDIEVFGSEHTEEYITKTYVV
jgi:hypothetical protein